MRAVAAVAVLAALSFAPAPGAREAREARESVHFLRSLPSFPSFPSTSAPAEPRVPFAPGETLTYDVSWSSYLTAGEATATVREKRPARGGSTYYIVAEGRPVGLITYFLTGYYKADTLLDASTLAPARGSIFMQENSRRQYKVSEFDQAAHAVSYEVTGRAASPRQTLRVPANTQDLLSALYVIRTLALKSGATSQMSVFDSGGVYRVRLTGGRVEKIGTGTGPITAQRIDIAATLEDGQRIGQNLAVWLSTDGRRLPVMLNADLPVGSFRLTLRGVK